MTTLRAGLSGCGAAGRAVIEAVRGHQHCAIAAVHDADATAVQALQHDGGIGFGTTRFEDLLGTGVDFVVLTGPGSDRLAQVHLACEQAVPVLLHAPMAPSPGDAELMVAAANEAGLALGVYVAEMADPTFEQVRCMLADGWFGGLVAADAFRGDDELLRRPPTPGDPRLRAEAFGAGPLQRLVASDVHLLAWLTGRRCVQVTAQATRGLLPLPCDSVAVTAQLRGNALAAFAASHVTDGRSFTLRGTDGRVQWLGDHLLVCGTRPYDGAVFAYDTPGRTRCLALADLAAASDPLRPALDLHGRFARWLDDLDGFPCPGEQALLDLRAVAAMQRSLASGAREIVSP